MKAFDLLPSTSSKILLLKSDGDLGYVYGLPIGDGKRIKFSDAVYLNDLHVVSTKVASQPHRQP